MILGMSAPVIAAVLCRRHAGCGNNALKWPVGAFEIPQFSKGTEALARAIVVASPGFSLVKSGDTLAAIDQSGVSADISYISTGGVLPQSSQGRTSSGCDAQPRKDG